MDTSNPPPVEPVFTARGLTKVYGEGEAAVHALRGVDLDIVRGEFVVLLGASGSGKSTLLNILGGLDVPSAGQVTLAGSDLSHLSVSDLDRLRNQESLSLQLTGTGSSYADFTWVAGQANTYSAVNTGQTFLSPNAPGEIRIGDAVVVEGDNGTQNLVFTVRRAGGTALTSTVAARST